MTNNKEEILEKAIIKMIKAWQELPGGKDYSPREVAAWIKNDLTPAINNLRKAVGVTIPKSLEDYI